MSDLDLKVWIVDPVESINECENPLPWTLDGIQQVGSTGTLETSTLHVRNGGPCLRITNTTAWWNKPMNKLETSVQYELLMDVKSDAGNVVKLEICNSAGNPTGAQKTVQMSGEWQWCRLPFVGSPGLTFRVSFASGSGDIYVDRLSVQKGTDMTWFCGFGFDGSNPVDYKWEGKPWSSRSIHNGYDRRAGKRIDLDDFMNVMQVKGLGMGDWQQRMTAVMTGGSLYQDHIPVSRVFSIIGKNTAESKSELMLKRKALSLLIRPDGAGGKPVNLLYQAFWKNTGLPASEELTIECVCTSAMPDLSIGDREAEAVLTFIMPDPFLYANHYEGYKQGQEIELNSNNILMKKANGDWFEMPGLGEMDFVYALAQDAQGRIWAGGSFGVKYWTGTSWRVPWLLSLGDLNGSVYAIQALPNGDMYIGGTFTKLGKTLLNHVARLTLKVGDGVKYTVQMLAGGTDGDVYALHVDDDGFLMVGGKFENVGNPLVQSRFIARFNPYYNSGAGQWIRYGALFKQNGEIRSICDGGYRNRIAIAGQFEGSVSASIKNMAMMIATETNMLMSMGDTRTLPNQGEPYTNWDINRITRTRSGEYWYGGYLQFSQNPVLEGIGRMIGIKHEGMLNTVMGQRSINHVHELTDGSILAHARWHIFVGGINLGANIVYKDGQWNTHQDTDAITGNDQSLNHQIMTSYQTPQGDMVYGGRWTGTIRVPGPPDTIPVVSEATAGTYPIVRVFGAQRLRSIFNKRTGKSIYFNGTLLPEDAWLEMELQPDAIRVRIDWQNRLDIIRAGSDLANFALEPGLNDIRVDTRPEPDDNITDLNRGDVYVLWKPRYWSLEGATHGNL